ncbi:MAG: histidine phosphatase family protein [Actinobacteria bacterium]|nr:MAG: histidine phosphatase family protein [Actinomycetota bacterium]
MEFVLIRHAQPEWVKDGLSIVNPPLSTLGFRQADVLGERLKDDRFDHVFVSPLLRACQTAAPLLKHHDRPQVVEPWLEEIREPAWHGQPAEVTIKAYNDESKSSATERWNGLTGGEAVSDFVARIRAGCTDFLARNGVRRQDSILPVWDVDDPSTSFVFVAHAGTNSVIICHLLGLAPTPWEWERFVIGHASMTTIKAIKLGDGYTFSLENLSDLEHLPMADRTR